MSQVIRIPINLYERLKNHAQGFDTPSNIIERILNYYEENTKEHTTILEEQPKQPIVKSSSLEIIYHPSDKNIFHHMLIDKKRAFIHIYKTDGSSEKILWNASKISLSSNIGANLRSGYLRGWRDKGIIKAVVAIEEKDIC